MAENGDPLGAKHIKRRGNGMGSECKKGRGRDRRGGEEKEEEGRGTESREGREGEGRGRKRRKRREGGEVSN